MDLSGILNQLSQYKRLNVLLGKCSVTAVVIVMTGCSYGRLDSSRPQQGIIPLSSTHIVLREIVDVTEVQTVTWAETDAQTPVIESATTSPDLMPIAGSPTASAATSSLKHIPSVQGTTLPTRTGVHTSTPSPTETSIPTLIATITAEPITVNGVPQDKFIVLPDNVRQNIREIFAHGGSLGRNTNAFSKLGDSVTLTDHFLTRFDSGHYTLGQYEFLQPTIDHYSGSFGRYGVASRVGLHAWSIFDPLWANKDWCFPDEHMVACEIRLFNPSILLIKIGSNDNGAADDFDQNVRQLVDYVISNGIIPVLATKADRFEGPDDRNNIMLRQIASDYEIPLWDYDRIAATLPRRGLSGDDVHMTMADADDYTNPMTFERGYPISDLTALMMLHEILREVNLVNDT